MTSDHSGELSRVTSELKSVRSEMSHLRHQVSKTSQLGETVLPALQDVRREQQAQARKLESVQESLKALQTMYERDRIVDHARHEHDVAERQWQKKFGRYAEARNLAESIIDVVASGHVNRAVIRDVTERLVIATPRYWVAQATLAAAAWLDDEKEQHRRALEHALALDYEKTSLFMALLLRDQNRDVALQEWLGAYLSRLTPVSLPRHFQVVIDAATGKALGDGSAPRLVKQVADWYREESDRQDIADAAVSEWQRRLLSLGVRNGEQPDFSALTANQAAWKVLSPRYAVSQAVEQAAGYFRQRFATGASVSNDVRRDLARLLGQLARTEDAEEEELLSTVREHRAITLAKGDLDAARDMIVADETDRRKTLNIVRLVSQAAFPAPENGQLPAPTVTELLAIMLSQRLIVSAAQGLRDELPAVGPVEITVGERAWTARFACDHEASTTRPALHDQAAEQTARICAEIQKDARRREGRLRWFKKWGCPSGLVAAAGLIGAGFVPADPRELVFAGFVVLVPSVAGMSRLPRLVRRAADRLEAEKREVAVQIAAAADQLADLWEADRNSVLTHLPDLRGYLNSLTPNSLDAATRPLPGVSLPRTREFPDWTPRPPRRHLAIGVDDDLPPLVG